MEKNFVVLFAVGLATLPAADARLAAGLVDHDKLRRSVAASLPYAAITSLVVHPVISHSALLCTRNNNTLAEFRSILTRPDKFWQVLAAT